MKISLCFPILFCSLLFNGYAQDNNELSYRFASRDEARQLIAKEDSYTRGWSQFDIVSRVQDPKSTKEKLVAIAAESALEWTAIEKEKIDKAFAFLKENFRKNQFHLPFPQEIIMVKTTMRNEAGASAYTRANWIAIGQYVLDNAKDDYLQRLLAHELFHVLTRNNIAFKKKIYSAIGFTVRDQEITFPSDFLEKRISNPDVSRYDSYAVFTVKGEKKNCIMSMYADREYTSGNFSGYVKIGFIPLDETFTPIRENGKTVIFNMEDISDFYDQAGRNTSYVIDPEEALADNFSFVIIEMKELRSPEITNTIKRMLQE